MSGTTRPPAVAGKFYPADRESLLAEVQSFLAPEGPPVGAIGCVIPHAGYMYSGHVAGAGYAALKVPSRVVILCPNHTGLGKPLSIMSTGTWETPLGAAAIDSALAVALKERFPLLTEDAEAHRAEHAIEVQLPFLQELRPDFQFVPIALGTQDYELLSRLGNALAEVIAEQHDSILIIASSDMNHYENDAITRVKDQKAIGRVLALDPRGLFEVVTRENISMCGVGPAVAMLTASRVFGARSAELVKYATSGDVSGERRMVVGYAGMIAR